MRTIVIVAHNLRSTHNVGSLLRTAEGLGVQEVILTGYTPYPQMPHEARLPHLAKKIDAQIHKTALGAETLVSWRYEMDLDDVVKRLRHDGFQIVALEQTAHSLSLPKFVPPSRMALVLGREVEGLEAEVLALCDIAVEIPMKGAKESFNVVQAAAMALYHCCFAP